MSGDHVFEENGAVPKTLRVEIRCLVPPTEEQRGRLRKVMAAKYGVDPEDVELVIRKDPSAVDGFNIFVGDDNYDWSTLGRIRQFRKSVQALPKEGEPEKMVS
ncbi:MAG: F0F1 ATP synthase subunit delta, partial [Clostridia bacterium]|nr:F0F1 ATP synthase subunit delta [Clostridia bacterium]